MSNIPEAPPAPPIELPEGASTEGRNDLLDSIQNFNKGGLKKAKTVDKSAPVVAKATVTDGASDNKAPRLRSSSRLQENSVRRQSMLANELSATLNNRNAQNNTGNKAPPKTTTNNTASNNTANKPTNQWNNTKTTNAPAKTVNTTTKPVTSTPTDDDLSALDDLIAKIETTSNNTGNKSLRHDTVVTKKPPPEEVPTLEPPKFSSNNRTNNTSSNTNNYRPPVTETSSSSSPVCHYCSTSITAGNYLQALGKTYHRDHFMCSSCSRLLSNEFYPSEDKNSPLCQQCYTNSFMVCAKCARPIMDKFVAEEDEFSGKDRKYHPECFLNRCSKCSQLINGPAMKALERYWHSHCFTCTLCRKNLEQSFVEKDNQPYCMSCGNGAALPNSGKSCEGCGRPVTGVKPSISLKDKSWHEECFHCSECNTLLSKFKSGGNSIQVRQTADGNVLCENCYTSGRTTTATIRCDRCGRDINSRYIESDHKKYHQECFTCVTCGSDLGMNYYLGAGGEPTCENCAFEKCDECRQNIGGEYLSVLNRKLHPHCFKCANCKTQLRDEYYPINNRPHCRSCAQSNR